MCFPWWSLILCFVAGNLSMLAFWLTLAKFAMTVTRQDDDPTTVVASEMGRRGNGNNL